MSKSGRLAIVTLAASGIGAACVRAWTQLGGPVIAIDIAPMESLSDEIGAAGGHCEVIVGDVSLERTWAAVASRAKGLGGADVLFSVAGFSQLSDNALTLSAVDWARLIDVNLTGTWLSAKHLAPQMQAKGGGAIVNMSSAAALIGAPNHAAYSASKGGVLALTRQLAVELAPDGIRVNAVCPGPVDTPMVNTNTPEAMAAIVNAVPLKRMATAEEVAQVFLFLASDAARSMTGATLPVDGGMTISL